MIDLGLDNDELATCVQCGLCLTACPTYRVTGDEVLSPRGRIALMRHVQAGHLPLDDSVVNAFETCVQCRACEPACPSGAPYGRLIEDTRQTLAVARLSTPRWLRWGLAVVRYPRLLRLGSVALGLAQRTRLVPRRLDPGLRLPLRQPRLRASGDDVVLFTGCVMDAWQRDVHLATQRVLEAAGFGVRPSGSTVPCCGALHAHAGLASDTRQFAAAALTALPADRPIIVNSAGCGAAMKDYGRLLGTTEAEAFSARVFDVHEWLAQHLGRLPSVPPLRLRVAVQDPCHLRNVQRAHLATRTVLEPFVEQLIELDSEGMCCGAGGAYSLVEPTMATLIRERTVESLERARPDVVASANPGCALHLAAAGVATRHPMQLLDEALNCG